MRKYNKMFNGMSKKDKIKTFKEMYHKPERRGSKIKKLLFDGLKDFIKNHRGIFRLGVGAGVGMVTAFAISKKHDKEMIDNTNISF